jgi:protein TonB
MRRDLIIGILCSVLIHAGIGFGGQINFHWTTKKKVVKDEAPVIQIEMPKMEPEPPEPQDTAEATNEAATIAPPSVADVPGVVDLNSFVQPVEPPPAPKGTVTLTIPKNNGPVASKGLTEVFDLKNLDQQPVTRLKSAPVYPFEMKRQGITAEVIVEFICDINGEVRDATIYRSGNPAFNTSALDAIYKWKFRPGKKGGRAVNARMQVPFVFSIEE